MAKLLKKDYQDMLKRKGIAFSEKATVEELKKLVEKSKKPAEKGEEKAGEY